MGGGEGFAAARSSSAGGAGREAAGPAGEPGVRGVPDRADVGHVLEEGVDRRRVAPELGQHTEAVLREVLRVDEARYSSLVDARIVGPRRGR